MRNLVSVSSLKKHQWSNCYLSNSFLAPFLALHIRVYILEVICWDMMVSDKMLVVLLWCAFFYFLSISSVLYKVLSCWQKAVNRLMILTSSNLLCSLMEWQYWEGPQVVERSICIGWAGSILRGGQVCVLTWIWLHDHFLSLQSKTDNLTSLLKVTWAEMF